MSQMPLAYSEMVRSLENFPEPATFRIAFCAQAFGLAYKMSKEPAAITDKDRAALIEVFGRERTCDLIYYVAWCNYMTRIADAFQLPLEKENAFTPPPKK